MIIYLFSQDIPIYLAYRLFPEVSERSYTVWYSKLRGHLLCSLSVKMDGTIETGLNEYEFDESCFGKKRKYNRGSITNKVWVFGILQRGTRKTSFVIVKKRDRETLLPIIKSKVCVGATIYTDDWKAYSSLEEHGYKHDVVIHKKSFVSETGACTNGIEGLVVDFL